MVINYDVKDVDAGPCSHCGARTEIRQIKPGRKPCARDLLVWRACTNRDCGVVRGLLTMEPQTCQ
jgi:hypothetical protein